MKYLFENWKRFLKETKVVRTDEPYLAEMFDTGGVGDAVGGSYRRDENDEVVEYIINATRVGQAPDEITQGLIEAGLTKEQALAALADAFDRELPGEEVEVDLDESSGKGVLDEKKKKKQQKGKKRAKKKAKRAKKGDRCTRIAKRKYDVWPSAYASGAVVRCRSGKIWKGVKEEVEDDALAENTEYEDLLEEAKKKKKKKKAGTESSKESSLKDWFGRKGAKGKKGGWVDCNAPDGKGGYKSCGREKGEKRGKYPACRPTPGACKEKGKGKSWGKKAKKNEMKTVQVLDVGALITEESARYLLERDVFPHLAEAHLDDGTPVCVACLMEQLDTASCGCPDLVYEAEYQGRKVTLNKPTRGDVKKFKVYVKDPKTGNVRKVNFGHGGSSAKAKGEKTMKIRKSNPEARKNFRARHNCADKMKKKDVTSAGYWSCKKW